MPMVFDLAKPQELCQGSENRLYHAFSFAFHIPALWAMDTGVVALILFPVKG